jgi:uncharacterized membrane protein (DUF2068 family)
MIEPSAPAAPATTAGGLPPNLPGTVPGPTPGTVPRKRFRPRIDYELVSCGLHGHELVAVGADEVRLEDSLIVREIEAVRWHRCLRCDAWIPFEIPTADNKPVPPVLHPPSVDDVTIPTRGRKLRDHYVLRLIVLDRILHALVIGALAVVIFAFANDRDRLHKVYLRIESVLNSSTGSWWVRELNKLFAIPKSHLYLLGVAAAVYAAVLVVEAVGLWGAKRWAEYLTVIEVAVFIPYEIYELTRSVTFFKVGALIVNIAIVLYLLLVHRLFGLRGGIRAARAAYGETG